MDEINEVFYTITTWDGSQMETADREEAKVALREGGVVIKNSRKIFRSGLSDIRLYVNTEIHKIKDIWKMSVAKGKTESRQQQFEKMKRWLAEREDRLDAEMVRAKMQAILAERKKPKSPK